MPVKQHPENLEELWKRISYVHQIEIDLAVTKGSKPEAVNRCMCSVKGLDLVTAQKLIEFRRVEITKKI